MSKITKKNLSKRLLQYGALTSAVLGVSDAAGQIVYVDVEPDAIIAVGETFSTDFEEDGFEDVSVANPADLANGFAAIVFPSSGGAFVGLTAGGYQYPALLNEGDIIDDTSGYTEVGVRGDLNYYGCAYSNSQWCDTVVDGYLGVKFNNLLGGTDHYGWIRMDTDVNGTNLMVVKGYAFNLTPDTVIEAGDEGVLSLQDEYFNDFNYYIDSNSQLVLNASTSLENIQLYNLPGQQVISKKLSNTNETINIASLDTGIYIAKVSIQGKSKSFKIVKN
ncbi:MAG: hypothetical protein CMC65_02610 [Flavobacteriaceae bacterium]|nr:hypothetical protein [Flavobacteriaceae bacterium]MDG1330075.1 T9SS type A sorting domain-containing protein [Flavobacteriaceae bacterium]|tara:strand:- start:13318 stop:14145 length:828 start_codon:yes stop_codon:yes gene_type:complete